MKKVVKTIKWAWNYEMRDETFVALLFLELTIIGIFGIIKYAI